MSTRSLSLTLIGLTALAPLGCNALQSVGATTIVAGTVVKTPELQVMGRFDVGSEVLASAWVAERESATSTAEPVGLTGAEAVVTFSGNRVDLVEQSQPGLYLTTSVDDAGLLYAGGSSYTFRAVLPENSAAEYGGTVTAPTALTPAALTLSPQPTETYPGFDDVLVHPKSTALTVTWGGTQYGRYAYVSVLRADPNDASNPQLIYDNRPESAEEFLEFVLGTPPENVMIPADTFAMDGVYAVIVVTMDKQDELFPNTFLGSPILAGSGAAVLLGVSSM